MRRLLIAAVALMAARALSAQPLTYAERRIERTLPGCGDSTNGCAHVEFDYIEITSGPPAVRYRINQAIGTMRSADQFIADYRASVNPQAAKWSLERKVKVLRAKPPVISLECHEFEYSGGAHPTQNTSYLNFNTATGEPVKLAAILKDGALPKLTQIAEVYFRKQRNLAPNADLKREGFAFFKNDRFALNENFGIGEKSLVFTFNIYEIAPYYMGPTAFEIPFAAIRDLLRPESGIF